MPFSSLSSPSIGRLLLAVLAMAPVLPVLANTVDGASFGQDNKIAPEGSLKHWLVSSHGGDFQPQLLSDRIILTPPYPGHIQGALWTEKTLTVPEWLVDFDFRVTGPEHGKGQLQLWYTKENQHQIGHRNLYGVDKFTGLALLIDEAGGRGGGIRAFLNDGQKDYSKSNVDQLPFGHCDYAYRNLGMPSKLQLHQDGTGLEVLIDGRRCFKADNVFLPANNYFGVTANSGETPDSFEIFRFVTQTGIAIAREEPVGKGQEMGGAPHQHQQNQGQQNQEQKNFAKPPPPRVAGTPDSPMLNDIHSHVLSLGKQIPDGVGEIKQRLADLQQKCASREELRSLESKLDRIIGIVEKVSNEQRDWSGHFKEIQSELRTGTSMFMDKLPESMGKAITTHGPSVMQIVFIIVAAQLLMGLAYILYKRRESSPKKYL